MNRVIVITGASSGIGLAMAKRFYDAGDIVYGVSRHYPTTVYDFKYLLCDLTKEEEIKELVSKIMEESGHVDILINCAGMGISGAIEETPTEQCVKIFESNVKSVFMLTREMIPLLRMGTKPRIINFSSVAGEIVIPFQTFYSMTKAAIEIFSTGLSMELKPEKIQVSTVMPGDTQTGFTAAREKNPSVKDSIYHRRLEKSVRKMEHDEQNGVNPDYVARIVQRLAKRRRMPVVRTVGIGYKILVFLNRILPRRLARWIIYLIYGN